MRLIVEKQNRDEGYSIIEGEKGRLWRKLLGIDKKQILEKNNCSDSKTLLKFSFIYSPVGYFDRVDRPRDALDEKQLNSIEGGASGNSF